MQYFNLQRRFFIYLPLFFIIIFVISHGCGSSTGGKKQKKSPTAPPANLQAVQGDGFITLSWDNAGDVTSYNLYMASQSGVTRENYAGLSDGMKHAGVTSPHMHTNL